MCLHADTICLTGILWMILVFFELDVMLLVEAGFIHSQLVLLS
jgi:hypothetical protein